MDDSSVHAAELRGRRPAPRRLRPRSNARPETALLRCSSPNGAQRSPRRARQPEVVDVRAFQRPIARRRLLMRREHVQLVVGGEAPDQREQRRNDAHFAGAVHAAGNDERDLHSSSSQAAARRHRDARSAAAHTRARRRCAARRRASLASPTHRAARAAAARASASRSSGRSAGCRPAASPRQENRCGEPQGGARDPFLELAQVDLELARAAAPLDQSANARLLGAERLDLRKRSACGATCR